MVPRLGLYHSSCHAAMADDALDANKMNVNPGGKQRKMRHDMARKRSENVFCTWYTEGDDPYRNDKVVTRL